MKTKVTSRLLAVLLAMLLAFGSTSAVLADALVIPTSHFEELTQDAVDTYYARLMACKTATEMDAIAAELEQKNGLAFCDKLTEEQYYALECKFNELLAIEDAEFMLPEEPTDELQQPTEELEDGALPDAEQQSGIVFETVDFTNAAPFRDPVIGSGSMQRMLTSRNSVTARAEDSDGLELEKTVSEPDEKGVYTLTLEAWATGEKTITQQEKNIPTDIVLVLDQSGSMDNSFTSVTYVTTSGTPAQLYNNRNSLYVKVGNNQYSSVTVSREQGYTYTAYSGQSNSTYYTNRSSLYHECSTGRYGKVTVSRGGTPWNRTYAYTCANGCTLGSSNGASSVPTFNTTLYRGQQNGEYTYTFSYEKVDGTIETATVGASESAPTWDFYLSQAGGNTTRLAALKTAVTTFANEVATKAKGEDGTLGTDDDVDHTISVVGFGRANYSTAYLNTEVFVGATQYKYGTDARAQYGNAPQDMSTSTGVANVTASIGALDAEGGTYVDLGIEMANGILDALPEVPAGEQRNRVVVVFTDGAPGYNGSYSGSRYGNSGDAQAVADAAMTQIATTKNTHKATVYTVGIFTGADATSAGSNANNASDTERANYFMQRLSSNTSYPQTPSYYLSASDSSALTSIFKSISQNIEDGGTVVTLDQESVVQDVISDQFTLPAGASTSDIKVYTADYTAADTFADPVEFTAAQVSISTDGKTIKVTNFDFAENWVGTETKTENGTTTTTYRGKKLIIEIPIVERAGFLGGNGVATNAAGSGVYEDSTAQTPVEEFESPAVNVPIDDVLTVVVPDKNVYLYSDVTAEDLEAILDIKIGNVQLDMDAPNYGLADWQHAYVELDELIHVGAYNNVTADSEYDVTVTIVPDRVGDDSLPGEVAVTKSGTTKGKINVFKPFVTFKDSSIDYGTTDVADSYYTSNNYVKVEWKHATSTGTPDGTAPALSFTYAPAVATWAPDGTVTALVDQPVNATASMSVDGTATDITGFVTSIRQACNVEGCNNAAESSALMPSHDPEFVVHITNVVGDLTITKIVKDSTFTEGSKTFTFTITAEDGQTIPEGKESVTITVNGTAANDDSNFVVVTDLVVGDYMITETTAEGYITTYSDADQIVEVKTDDSAAIIVTNTASKNIDVEVQKNWVDENNVYGLRPVDTTGVAITLNGNGTAVENGAVTLTPAGNWYYKWQNLPKFTAEGVEIDYTVVEDAVDNYTLDGIVYSVATVDDKETKRADVTNSLKRTELTISKTWNKAAFTYDSGDVESAIVNVLGTGVEYDVVLTEGNEYTVTITNLPVGLTLTLTEDGSWTWRYTGEAPKTITLKESGNSVSFNNNVTNESWLGGDNYDTNVFN